MVSWGFESSIFRQNPKLSEAMATKYQGLFLYSPP